MAGDKPEPKFKAREWVRHALALFILLSAAFAQEHAPTPEQCKADYLLWIPRGTEIVKGGYDELFKDVSWKELEDRAMEMEKCSVTDPEGMRRFNADNLRSDGNSAISYATFASSMNTAASLRQFHFLVRHHLMEQFIKEDEAGKRSQ